MRPEASVTRQDVRLDARGDLVELAGDGGDHLARAGRLGHRRFGLVDVEGRLERRVLGEERDLRGQVVAALVLQRREHPVAGFELGEDFRADAIADIEDQRDEESRQEDGDRREDRDRGADDETGRRRLAHD